VVGVGVLEVGREAREEIARRVAVAGGGAFLGSARLRRRAAGATRRGLARDLEALAGLVPEGVEGAIIGTALYEGRFTLEDALAVVSTGSTDGTRSTEGTRSTGGGGSS